MTDSKFITTIISKYFYSIAHLAHEIGVSRQYLHAASQGYYPLSDRVKKLITNAVVSKRDKKKRIETPALDPLNKDNVNDYLKKKFGKSLDGMSFYYAIRAGKLDARKTKNQWIVSRESLENFKFNNRGSKI